MLLCHNSEVIMSVWTETDHRIKYGVVVYNFDLPGKYYLKLNVGDIVHILKNCGNWYYCYNTRNRHIKGLLPSNYVHLKEVVVSKSSEYESITSKELPIVNEITSVLREWGTLWKNLYANSNGLDLKDFDEIRKMMLDLIIWRKQIMSHKLTVDELKNLQQRVTHKIDIGNARLGLDLVVRDEEGNILDPIYTSTISLYRQGAATMVKLWKAGIRKNTVLTKHLLATQRIQEDKCSSTDQANPWGTSSFNLYVNVKHFVCNVGEDSDLMLTLYDAKQGTYISENYIVKWGSSGMPRDINMMNNHRVLFTDLGQQDAAREKVFLLCQVIRIGKMDNKESGNKKQTLGLRRPFGVAGIDITDIMKGSPDTNQESAEDKTLFIPFLPCGDHDFLENVIRKLVNGRDVNHKGMGLPVIVKKLPGDLRQAQKDSPHMVSVATPVARKMGFPDVIMPGDERNDLYITLIQGEFRKSYKSSDRNVQVTVGVYNRNGDPLENVINEGSGGEKVTDYKSVIYYHEDKPRWMETIKISIPISEFYHAHLKFTFKHRSSSEVKDRSEKAFAMSYVKLMQENGTTLSDTIHDLVVYKIDSKKPEQSRVYLSLPATHSALTYHGYGDRTSRTPLLAGPLSTSSNDSFQITTLICSTKLTQNVAVMGLLKWRDNPKILKDTLTNLMSVDGEEIVKFLHDILDALFNILVQKSSSDSYDSLVLNALVFLVDLISNMKYHQFRPVLDLYIKENFSATLAYNKLLEELKYYIKNAITLPHDSILRLMKSLEYIFKFIIRSRILFAALNDGRGKPNFDMSLKEVFTALNHLMCESNDKVILVQGAALKYLPSTIADIITVFSPQEFSQMLVEFIDSVPPYRLVKQKMMCINEILHTPICKLPEARRLLLPAILEHVKTLLEQQPVGEADVTIQVLSDILDLLFNQEQMVVVEDLTIVVMSVIRTVIQSVIGMDKKSPHISGFVAALIAMLRQMQPLHYTQYINHFATDIDLTDFLVEIMTLFKDLVIRNVYPSDWNEMIMLQNSVFLKALRHFSNTIKERFISPFEMRVWDTFFQCAISFITQPPLQLENFSSSKRNKIIIRYKDMRREAGFEIRAMWHNLGQHKLEFIPGIVSTILEMTLIPETELRRATIPIFFDMLQCEFMSPPRGHRADTKHIKGNFMRVENEIIIQLDRLVESGKGDQRYQELFFNIMSQYCEPHSLMRDQGIALVETIKELLQRLLEYRAVINDENREHRMSCIVNLLNFYHDLDRQKMYIRYLHKLCDLHLQCDDYTEAAYTIELYSRLLNWSDDALPKILHSEKYPKERTHRELKQKVYYDMIAYLDKGQMWEKGIAMCQELARQMEMETFDYKHLGQLLQKQAQFYENILNEMRPEPEYFRVGYYGMGFPSFIQNKEFIYRGKAYERLSDFTARLQNQFPNAQLMKTLSPATPEIKSSSAMYLQINAVTPIMELKNHLVNKKVSDQILKYYKVNEVQKFAYSRKIEGKSNDITTLWVERTNLVTSYALPGILRWFPVTSTEQLQVSPLENAIEALESSNQKTRSLIGQYQADPSLRVDPLGMHLNGVVNAAVNGGIAKYQLFYSEDYSNDHSSDDDQQLIIRLRQVTKAQLTLLQTGIELHEHKVPEALMPFHAHMVESYDKLKTYVQKHFDIKVTECKALPAKRIQTMPAQRHSENLSLIKGGSLESVTLGGHRTQSVMLRSPGHSSPAVSPSRDSKSKFYTKMVDIPLDNTTVSDTSSHGSRSSSFSSLKNNRDSRVIELSEQLTPQRPLRPESDRRSRPISGQFRLTKPSSSPQLVPTFQPDQEQEEEGDYDEPPPLPDKQAHADYANTPETEEESPTKNHKPPKMQRAGTHKHKPQPPLPMSNLAANSHTGQPSVNPSVPDLPPKKPPLHNESEA